MTQLNVNRERAFVYVLSGGCAAIAAVVVGGGLLKGGLESNPATFAGALLLGLVLNILNFENDRGTISFGAFWRMVIRGAFLFSMILFQTRHMRPKKAVTA